MKYYTIVKLYNKSETIPDYLCGKLTFAEISAYFFNWHAHQETATINQIAAWFADKRGWTWQETG
jgi:hypothetical protein